MRKHLDRPTTLYDHPFSKAYWRDAASELKDVRILIFAALMIALRVAMKNARIIIAPGVTINTAFVVNALGAMTFGPVVAAVAAAVSDTLGVFLAPNGPYFFPFIFVEIAGSVIFALFLYRTKVTVTRVILSRFCIDLFVNILLNAPIMLLYYKFILGKSYMMFQVPHIIKNLLMFPVESFVLALFLSLMLPILSRAHLVSDKGDGLKFSKRHVVLMVTLFLVAAVSAAGYFFYDYNTANHAPRMEDAHPEELATVNDALTEEADALGMLEDGQIAIVSKLYKKWGQDFTVDFNIYDTTPETDMDRIRQGIRAKTAKDDPTLTKVGSGTAILVQGALTDVADLTYTPDLPPA